MISKLLIVSVLTLAVGGPRMAFSQKTMTDSVFVINDLHVKASRPEQFNTGGSLVAIDSAVTVFYRSQSLAQLLGDASGAVIRTYGPNGLASVTVRGGGTNHTPVIWNGINLQSPMNGGVNLSVLPVSLLNNVSVQYGGNSTLYGSGSMTGAVHLSNPNDINSPNNISANAQTGSFGSMAVDASIQTGNQPNKLRLGIMYKMADNDFKFRNTSKYGHPVEKQSNAGMEQQGASIDYDLKLLPFRLGISALVTRNNINIPTRMTDSNPNRETQTDDNLMASANLKFAGENESVQYKTGVIANRVLYNNPSLPFPATDNHSLSVINELEYKYLFTANQSLTTGINHTFDKAGSDAYAQKPSRSRLSAFAFYKLTTFNNKLEMSTSARQETSDDRWFPLVYSSGLNIEAAKWLRLKTCGSTTYRIPTFNDLYWYDAYSTGNPNLKPESGWSAEVSMEQHQQNENLRWAFSQTFFANAFTNWIVWLPDATGRWTPENKDKGTSEGVEIRASAMLGKKISYIRAEASYTYTRSEIGSKDAYNNRPMIYVPAHKAGCSIMLGHKGFSVLNQFLYTGKRYYDSANRLEPYFVYNLHLAKSLKVWGTQLSVHGEVNNLTASQYQVMAWYAMPGRNYAMGLRITI